DHQVLRRGHLARSTLQVGRARSPPGLRGRSIGPNRSNGTREERSMMIRISGVCFAAAALWLALPMAGLRAEGEGEKPAEKKKEERPNPSGRGFMLPTVEQIAQRLEGEPALTDEQK